MKEYRMSFRFFEDVGVAPAPEQEGIATIFAEDVQQAIEKQWPNSSNNGALSGMQNWVGTVTTEKGIALAVCIYGGGR